MSGEAETVTTPERTDSSSIRHFGCRTCDSVPSDTRVLPDGAIGRSLCGLTLRSQWMSRTVPQCQVCLDLADRPCGRCGEMP